MKVMRDNRGSITAAAAIVLSSIMIFNTVLIDYVKMKTKMSNIPAQMQLACKSVLASYDSLLADKYGLYGYNTSADSSAHRNFMEYYNAIESSVVLKDAFTDPKIMKKQIIGTMKIKTPVNIIETVLEALNVISDADKNCDEHSVCGKAAKKLTELQKIQKDLKIKVEGYYSGDPVCVNGFSKGFIDAVLDNFAYTEEKTFDKLLVQLISLHEQYLGYNNEAALLCNELKNGVDEINVLLSGLTKENNDKAGESAESIKFQSQILLNKAAFSMINYNCEAIKERLDLFYSFQKKEDLDLTMIKSVLQKNGLYTNIRINTINAQNDSGLGDNRENLTQNLKNEVESTFFYDDKYVIPSTEYSMLPSLRVDTQSESSTMIFDVNQKDFIDNFDSFNNLFSYWNNISFNKLIDDVTSKLLIDDYIITYMTSRRVGISDEKINNEIEYILCGNASCDKNNDAVEQKLIALRFILNFAKIMSSTEKVAAAEAMATAIAAVISLGAGITLYKYIIISTWALIDSYVDVENLINGKSVPIFEVNGSENNKINEMQDYNFYLRILLLFMNEETKVLRICDIIEINMKEITGENYNLSGVYNSISVKAITEFEFVSPVLLGIKRNLKREDSCEVSY